MVSEILTLKGESDGTSASGDFPLYSDVIYRGSPPFTLPTSILIPPGLKAKIWAKRLSAEGETTFLIYYSKDVTVPSPTWELLSAEKLASKGELTLEKRRPLIIRSLTGKEGFKISWLQPTASPSKAYIELEVELTDEE
ncbi:MAG: hypothetical protein QXY41_06015 [Thermoproteota archaeon]